MKSLSFFISILIGIYPEFAFCRGGFYSSITNAKHETHIVVDKFGNYETTETVHLRANNDTARVRLSAFQVMYYGKYEDSKIIAGGLIHKGKDEPINVADVKMTTIPMASVPGISELNMLTIPYPGVTTGDTIWYTRKTKTRSGKITGEFHTSNVYGFGMIEEKTITTIQSEIPLYITATDPYRLLEIKEQKATKPYTYEIRLRGPVQNVTESELPQLAAAQLKKRVMRVDITSNENWTSLAAHNRTFYNIQDSELNSVEANTFIGKIDKKDSPSTQAEEILLYLANNITYSARWLSEESGLKPRQLQEILKTRVADCKDFAKLFLSAAKKLGIEAEPVYTRIATELPYIEYMSTPMDSKKPAPTMSYFNHVVVRYKNNGVWITIDPGRRLADASRTPHFLIGSWSFNIHEDKPAYQLEISQKDYASINIKSQMSKRPDGALVGNSELEVSGEAANLLRSAYFDSGHEAFNSAVAALLPAGTPKSVEIAKTEVTRNSGILKLSVSYSVPEADQKNQKGYEIPLPIQIFKYNPSASQATTTGMTFPHTITQEVHFSSQFIPSEVTKDCYALGPLANAERTVLNTKDGVTIKDRVELNYKKGDPDESEISRLRSNVSNLHECSQNSLFSFEDKKSQKSFEDGIDTSKTYEVTNKDDHSMSAHLKRLREVNFRIEKDSKSAPLYLERAEEITSMATIVGNVSQNAYHEMAIQTINKALEIDPKNALYHAKHGVYHLRADRYNEARKQFDIGHKLNPKEITLLNLGGLLLEEKKKFTEAEKYYLAALKQQGTNDMRRKVLSNLASLYCYQLLDCAKSYPLYDQIIALNPKDAWSHHNAAVAYHWARKFDRAIEYERKALEIMSFGAAKSILTSSLVGQALSILAHSPRTDSNISIAEKHITEVYKMNSSDTEALTALVKLYMLKAYLNRDLNHIKTAVSYVNEIKDADEGTYYTVKREADSYQQMVENRISSSRRDTASVDKLTYEQVKKLSDDANKENRNLSFITMQIPIVRSKIAHATFLCGASKDAPAPTMILSINHTGQVTDVTTPAESPKGVECIKELLSSTRLQFPPPVSPFYLQSTPSPHN